MPLIAFKFQSASVQLLANIPNVRLASRSILLVFPFNLTVLALLSLKLNVFRGLITKLDQLLFEVPNCEAETGTHVDEGHF
jgi:hypothetical protein